jgi:hypothetical protein
LVNVSKAYTLKCAAYNLGLQLRKLWDLGKPRRLADYWRALLTLILAWRRQWWLRAAKTITHSPPLTRYGFGHLPVASPEESGIF